jgi:L-lysine exporter family protein LysE/ArgO
MTPFLLGLILGLTLIVPVGVQSLFVLNQGLLIGFPRALVGVAAVCLCDTFLIIFGAVGISAILAWFGYQDLLIAAGSTYLVVMGLLTLRARVHRAETERLTCTTKTMVQAVVVSVLNPHAILDTVGILGGAISSQAADGRILFAAGVVGASWVWYSVLGMGASVLQRRITPWVRSWIQRTSGALMLIFAGMLIFGPV